MSTPEVTERMLISVAQFIGADIKNNARVHRVDMSTISIPDMTWEEFVNYVFDYMVSRFIIEKYDGDEFGIGISWIKRQHWKAS